MLTDTGPLLALLDKSDAQHARCAAALPGLRLPLVTTDPVLTEAMYLLGDRLGWPGQAALWRMVGEGKLEVVGLEPEMRTRMAELMERYRDVPMDYADASLVALAEARGLQQVFTVDSDFLVYRLGRRRAFQVVPEP